MLSLMMIELCLEVFGNWLETYSLSFLSLEMNEICYVCQRVLYPLNQYLIAFLVCKAVQFFI